MSLTLSVLVLIGAVQDPQADRIPIPDGWKVILTWIDAESGSAAFAAKAGDNKFLIRIGREKFETDSCKPIRVYSTSGSFSGVRFTLPKGRLFVIQSAGHTGALLLKDSVDSLSAVHFDRQGRILGYIEKAGKMETAVVEGKRLKIRGKGWLHKHGAGGLVLSDETGERYWLNGRRFTVPRNAEVRFSRDGTSIAHCIKVYNKSASLYVNGRKVVTKGIIWTWGLDPRGRLFYAASNRKKEFWDDRVLYWNKKVVSPRGCEFSGDDVAFSPDGKRIAYFADMADRLVAEGKGMKEVTAGRYVLMLDKEPVHTLTLKNNTNPLFHLKVAFSPNGKRVAWADLVGDETFVHTKKYKSRAFARIRDLQISDNGTLIFVGIRGGRKVIVVNGKEIGEGYDDVGYPPAVSPNGNRIVWTVSLSKKWRVLDGEKAGAEYDRVMGLRFRKDGRLVYAAKKGRSTSLYIDGKEAARGSDCEFVSHSGGVAWVVGSTVVTENEVMPYRSFGRIIRWGDSFAYWAWRKDDPDAVVVTGNKETRVPADRILSFRIEKKVILLLTERDNALSVHRIELD